jgi:hypothetical protein
MHSCRNVLEAIKRHRMELFQILTVLQQLTIIDDLLRDGADSLSGILGSNYGGDKNR